MDPFVSLLEVHKLMYFMDVIAKIHAWNDRKAQFSDRQIHIALEVLGRKGWLPIPIPTGLA
ncbi:MAG: hypothetical protein H7833_12805 [Magnetococcus sp. DMHC-1]